MATAVNGKRIAKTVTSVVALSALGTAGMGSVAFYGTITAANAAKAVSAQSTTSTSTGPQSNTDPQSSTGVQLLPGNGGRSHSQSTGS